MSNFCIVKSHVDLLKYVESLQAKNSDALGFLPRVVFEQGVEAGRLFLGLLNGNNPCGYILAGSGYRGLLRCPQVCIPYDARRRLYGAMLVAAVEQYGESIGCFRRVVRCGSDLESNAFWDSLGYHFVGTDESGEARKYKRSHINLWVKPLFPAVVATAWVNGRPRIYASDADRQGAYQMRRRDWLSRYQITDEDYRRMLDEQDNTCARCRTPFGAGNRPTVDHSHNCSNAAEHKSRPLEYEVRMGCADCVRGLICKTCNTSVVPRLETFPEQQTESDKQYLASRPIQRYRADGMVFIPKAQGRPRIYTSDADRLRAWRERKRNLDSQNCAVVETELPLTKSLVADIICPTVSECRQFGR
jgi:hypothetical protein